MPAQPPRPSRNAASSPAKTNRAKSSSGKATPVNSRRRIVIIATLMLLWMGAISYRLVALQVVRYGEFTQRAARQQQRSVEVSPKRGLIYDRNGHELAMTINVDSVYAVPSEIPDQAMAANLMAKILNADPQEMLAKIQSSRNFVWIARKLDNDVSTRIKALSLKGVYFEKESKRYYPKNELAAAVLGFVGTDDEGLGGIERSFDERMRGRAGKMLVSVDARQRSLGRVEKQPEQGASVVLTLDEKIQYIAERELERSMQETKAEAGTVIVQDPKTGEILALASRPTFNPNTFRKFPQQALKNRAVSDIYEPGSTFKILTIAAALEEKLTNPQEVIDCQMGSITIFGHKIRDHKPFGLLSTTQIMQNSSDVGAIKLALRLGDQRFDNYIRAFGFGSQTGIELPGETRGLHKPASRWTKASIGAISMGQEVGVSGLQLVSMVSAIANDGVYVPPRIVAGTLTSKTTGQTVVFKPAESHRVISTMTAAQMKRMLEDTVLFGTGKKAILDGYTSAGKTGTAQKIDPATGTYHKWKHIASFAGFAPVNQPAVTIHVMLDSPVGAHHGGDVAAPLWNRITQQVLAYMNVPHDADVKNPQRLMLRAKATADDFSEGSPDRFSGEMMQDADGDASLDPIAQTADQPQLIPAVERSRMTPDQLERAKLINASFTPAPKPQRAVQPAAKATEPPQTQPAPPAKGTVIMQVDSGPVTPSFVGKTVRAAMEEAQRSGVELDVVGTGVAKSQYPLAGDRLPAGTRVTVRFSR